MKKPVRQELLQPGFELPGHLYNQADRLLLSAGKRLGEKEAAVLTAISDHGLYGGTDWPADYLEETDAQLATKTLPDASPSHRSRFESNTPFRRASTLSDNTESFGRQIDTGFHRLNKNTGSSISPETPTDDLLLGELIKHRPLQVQSNRHRPKIDDQVFPRELQKARQLHAQSLGGLSNIYKALAVYQTVSLIEVRNIIIPFMDVITPDADLVPALIGGRIKRRGVLVTHALDVSLLCMAVAAQMGLDRRAILEVGMGGVLHDTGMMGIPRSIIQAPRVLTPGEKRAVQHHPRYTLNYLQGVGDLSPAARLIAFQVHERPNGNGYPEHLHTNMIHPLAHIAAVADTYIAMTSPRPWRPAMKPYTAVKTILDGVQGKEFEGKTVEAFLNTLGLFPVGSEVRLNDGQSARVLRANPDQQARPVVQILHDEGQCGGEILDLSQMDHFRIISAP